MSQSHPYSRCFMSTGVRISLAGIIGIVLSGFTGWITAGPPPESPNVSDYASPAALMSGVEYYIDRIEKKSLTSKEKYSEATQTRVAKDGATLVIQLLALGLHDQDSAVKASAPKLVELAEELVSASADYDKAKAAFDALKNGIANGAEGGKPLAWEKRCDLGLLMKQVTTIQSKLKRNTKKESSLAKRKEDAAGQAALLAVIGQATLVDIEAAKESTENVLEDESKLDEKLAEWYKYSEMMRDSSGAIEAAIAAGDFATITKQKDILQQSCDDCHEVFDIDE